MDEIIKETLKKQLELLSKRSDNCDDEMLLAITSTMVEVCSFLSEQPGVTNEFVPEDSINGKTVYQSSRKTN